jgi:hypothetical protein
MNAKQIAFPFSPQKKRRQSPAVLDLIGRSYREDYETVTVIGICANDGSRVLVQRQPRGSINSFPAWLMRAIFAEEKQTKLEAA